MTFAQQLREVQRDLKEKGIDGWLLYDFCKNNDLAHEFLQIPEKILFSRRFLYWIPQEGEPIKIVHRVEAGNLDHLPGEKLLYLAWQELEAQIAKVLEGAAVVAMEYSPRNAIPYVSKVDAGTVEVVRDCGVEVVSSANLLQQYSCVWDERQLASHLEAARILDETVAKAWRLIGKSLAAGDKITEYDVQSFILSEISANGCISASAPICAIKTHSADPHYTPSKERCSEICKGDFILIDLWCKKDETWATYADITRVAVAAEEPTPRQKKIFAIVKDARDDATALVKSRFEQQKPLMGWEVDEEARSVIREEGYGDYFIHRTGHNIHVNDHGNGAHVDNLETQDRRFLLPGTCFSIEPGIYLPDEFGVRLEYDVVVDHDGSVRVTGGIQDEIVCLLAPERRDAGARAGTNEKIEKR